MADCGLIVVITTPVNSAKNKDSGLGHHKLPDRE